MSDVQPERRREWTFITNHAVVLAEVASFPDRLVREIAARADITERAVQGILRDLVEAGYIEVRKIGRRNTYRVRADTPFRTHLYQHRRISELLRALDAEPN
jgi:DNA-binding transcriptional ArsR family regulator